MGEHGRSETLKKYDRQFSEFAKNLLDLMNLDCIITQSPKDHLKFAIRDSILYRFQSIRFHLDLLLQTYEMMLTRCYENFLHEDICKLENEIKKVFFIFDDIVFNICSMLDYFGNMIGYLYMGENKSKIKWNGVVKSAHDKNNKFSDSEIAECIKKEHKEWVDHLFCYRSMLIHHRIDVSKIRRSLKYDGIEQNFDVELFIGIPVGFLKTMKVVSREEADVKGLSIIDIAIWLSSQSLETASYLTKKLKDEIRPVIMRHVEKKIEKLRKSRPELFK